MRQRVRLNASRKNGFSATVSARALNAASFNSLSGFDEKNSGACCDGPGQFSLPAYRLITWAKMRTACASKIAAINPPQLREPLLKRRG